MRESRTYGSVRGALSNGRPYRVPLNSLLQMLRSPPGTSRHFTACSTPVAFGPSGHQTGFRFMSTQAS